MADEWVGAVGLNVAEYGTQSMRRTKASLIYKATDNLRAVQILLGHTNIENIVRYLGVDIDDALSRFKAGLARITNVANVPAPEINVLDINLVAPVIAVRSYCHTDNYWQVYLDMNAMILRVAADAGWPAPTPAQIMLTKPLQA